MLNLIDQQDILKGLDDTALQREMQQPSGGAPPFLVLSEISRRKDMRQRYAGELAMKAPPTTVAQDVLSAPAMPGMGPMGAPPGGGGLAAAAQMGGGAPSPMPAPGGPGFASGGIVAAADPSVLDYNSLAQKYQSDLDSLPQDRNQAAALALLAAGAGIMGGGHSNLGQNLGVGINAGVTSYQDALKTTDARETNALRGLSDIAANQHNDALQRLQEADRMNPNSPANTPQSIREIQYVNGLPDGPEKDAAMKIITPFAVQKSDVGAGQAQQIGDAIISGDQAPTTTGLGYGMSGPVRAYLASKGYDLQGNYMKYQADLKNISALNSPQQLRVRQGVDQLDETLSNVQQLADTWNGSGFPPFNHASLVAEANNPNDPKKQALATELLAQVDHVTSELGQVYMGGNTPTDAAFSLAKSQLSADWSKATFDAMINQTKQNLAIRRASLNQVGIVPQGVGPASAATPGAPVGNGTTSTNIPFSIEP